jgi:hypothetical protein
MHRRPYSHGDREHKRKRSNERGYIERRDDRQIQRISMSQIERTRYHPDRDEKLAIGTPGIKGRKVLLLSNYYRVRLPENELINQYAVHVTPTKGETPNETPYGTSPRFFGRLIYDFFKQREASKIQNKSGQVYLFDGEHLFFTRDKMEDIEEEFSGFNISIKWIKQVHTYEFDNNTRQIFNLILRFTMSKLGLLRIMRNYYDIDQLIPVSDSNISVLPGIRSTITFTGLGPLFNVDTVYKVLRTDHILDTYHKLKNKYRNREQLEHRFTEEVKGKVVFLPYRKKTVIITSVAFDKTPRSKFYNRTERREMTFEEYFFKKYKVEIKYLDQPMLICQRKNK